jgi:hypothetical protein
MHGTTIKNLINSYGNLPNCVIGIYKGSLVLRSRKFPFLLNLPTGWFHSECLCPHSLPLLSSLISAFGSSEEHSKNSSSLESTKQSRSESYSHCVHQQTKDCILNMYVSWFNLTEKLQVKVTTTNILAHRRNTGECILEALEWVGISYREIWSA